MRKIILLLIVIIPLQICGQTLSDVIQAALDFNHQSKSAKKMVEAAEQDKVSEEQSQLPTLSLKANYMHVTDEPKFDIPIPGFNKSISLNPMDRYETGIQLDYVVFSGFAQTQAVRVKEFEYKLSQLDENQKNKDVAFNTIQAYRNAQLMKLSLDILADTRQRNIVQMDRARALLENGMVLQLDTLSLALNRLDIEHQIIQSQAVLENWLQLLKTLTGKNIELSNTNEMNSNPGYNDYTAEDQNALKALQLQQQKIEAAMNISKSGYYPKVLLNASFNYGKPGIDIINNEWSSYGQWMIGLQWNIWKWGADQASVQARQLQFEALQFSEQSVADQQKLNYDKAVRAFLALKKQSIVAQKAVKVAREKMQIVQANMENGQLSASDFNEANLELSQAELRQKQNLVQLNLQANEIDYLSGKPVNFWRL